ncbi:MAG: ribonuclease Z [Candidatus Micrarchaeota archaeon]|nr:ribonuclease Z [Candidatus Micrarchaeota archaeon]
MKAAFLGTNGWFSTHMGRTTCAALILKGRLIVLDAGDGFYKAGELAKRYGVRKIDVFISHMHLDHVVGLHTLPLFPSDLLVRLFVHRSYLRPLLRLASHPYTASLSEHCARVQAIPLKVGLNRVPYPVRLLPLAHADPSFGFRLELEGREIAYCADTGPCKNLVKLAKESDALITECALLPEENKNRSWPHLSPEMAAQAAKEAGAKKLVLTHFDASKYQTEKARKQAERAAKKVFPNAIAAKDGMVLEI